jgi:hypothetical protein
VGSASRSSIARAAPPAPRPRHDGHERRGIVSHYLWSPGHLPTEGTLLPLAYPIGDLDVHRPVVDRHPAAGGPPPRALRALRAGIFVQFLGNAVWSVLEARGVYATGGVADSFWVVGYAALAVAVDVQRRAGVAVVERREDDAEAVPLHPLPFAAAAFVCSVLIPSAPSGTTTRPWTSPSASR